MVVLDVGRETPVAEEFGLQDKGLEGGLVGHHALDEPEREDIWGGFGDNGGEGLELVGVDVGAWTSQGPMNEVGARDAADIVGKEAHAILVDVEVRDEADVLGKVEGAVGLKGEAGGVC